MAVLDGRTTWALLGMALAAGLWLGALEWRTQGLQEDVANLPPAYLLRRVDAIERRADATDTEVTAQLRSINEKLSDISTSVAVLEAAEKNRQKQGG